MLLTKKLSKQQWAHMHTQACTHTHTHTHTHTKRNQLLEFAEACTGLGKSKQHLLWLKSCPPAPDCFPNLAKHTFCTHFNTARVFLETESSCSSWNCISEHSCMGSHIDSLWWLLGWEKPHFTHGTRMGIEWTANVLQTNSPVHAVTFTVF